MRWLIGYFLRRRRATLALGMGGALLWVGGAAWAFLLYGQVPTGTLPAIPIVEAVARAEQGGGGAWVRLEGAAWRCEERLPGSQHFHVPVGTSDGVPVLAMVSVGERCEAVARAAPAGRLYFASSRVRRTLLGAGADPDARLLVIDMVDTPGILAAAGAFSAGMAVLSIWIAVWAWRRRDPALWTGLA